MNESRKFRLQSAGVAYNLDIGFTPTKVTVWNATKWATDTKKVKFVWHYGMAADTALAEVAEDDGMNRTIEAANGFTLYDTSSVTSNYKTVSGGITKTNPGVVTVVSTTGWVAGDALRFQNLVEMTELNNTARPIYIKEVIDGTTFSILDTSAYGAAETSVTATVYNLSKTVGAEGFKGMTLGTAVIGENDDIMYIEAIMDDTYTDLGDLA